MSFSQKISAGQLTSTANNPSNGTSTNYSVPDSEYFVYGHEQDCSKVRVEYLNACLSISEKGESSIYLLNPRVINEAQEWEACSLVIGCLGVYANSSALQMLSQLQPDKSSSNPLALN